MSRHSQRTGKTPTRTILAAAFAVAGLAITGAGVYAGLNATATGTQSVTSGTLSLTLGNETGSTFTGAVSALAPGDVVNRYVNLTNGGTLASQGLTLQVAGAGSTLLTTNPTKGLAVTVSSCSTSWSVSAGVATCASAGTVAVVMSSTAVATLSTTPGAVLSSLAVGEVVHLKVSVALPDQPETTTNGTFPPSTIQGLSDTLTYTFNEAQRTATTTNS
jgi:spore coat-associated protein N